MHTRRFTRLSRLSLNSQPFSALPPPDHLLCSSPYQRTTLRRIGLVFLGMTMNRRMRGKRPRTNVHPENAERAVSFFTAGNGSPSILPRDHRADADKCRRISYFQWRRHGARHRDSTRRRRNYFGECTHSLQLYGQSGLYGQLHNASPSGTITILRSIHRARWRVHRRHHDGTRWQSGL